MCSLLLFFSRSFAVVDVFVAAVAFLCMASELFVYVVVVLLVVFVVDFPQH